MQEILTDKYIWMLNIKAKKKVYICATKVFTTQTRNCLPEIKDIHVKSSIGDKLFYAWKKVWVTERKTYKHVSNIRIDEKYIGTLNAHVLNKVCRYIARTFGQKLVD
jgi:hypothetical protein